MSGECYRNIYNYLGETYKIASFLNVLLLGFNFPKRTCLPAELKLKNNTGSKETYNFFIISFIQLQIASAH